MRRARRSRSCRRPSRPPRAAGRAAGRARRGRGAGAAWRPEKERCASDSTPLTLRTEKPCPTAPRRRPRAARTSRSRPRRGRRRRRRVPEADRAARRGRRSRRRARGRRRPSPPVCRASPRRHSSGRARSDVEALVLEVQVTGDAHPDVVRDRAAPPKLDESGPLGLEQLAAQSLVVLRAGLDRTVVPVVEARTEARRPEAVRPADPLGRVVPDPVLARRAPRAAPGPPRLPGSAPSRPPAPRARRPRAAACG